MSQSLDLTNELARLLTFTASVATAIRMYSAYSGEPHENAPLDLMFLSDSLHNFDQLGAAIQDRKPSNIVAACDSLLEAYARYQVEDPRWGERQGKRTFDRNANLVSLQEGIAVFTEIRAKMLPLVAGLAKSDVSQIVAASSETAKAVLSNSNTRIFLKSAD